MSLELLDTNFRGLSDGDFILKLNDFGKALESHPAYQIDLPAWVPGPKKFFQHASSMTDAIAAANRDKSKEPDKIAERKRGQQSFNFAAQYLVMYSVHHDDTSLLENIGINIKHRNYTREARKAIPGRLERLEIQEVKDEKGEETDRLQVITGKSPERGSVELQYTDNPADESSWATFLHLYECRSIVEKKGLQRVKKYYFRGRYSTAGGAGPWSEIVKHVVL